MNNRKSISIYHALMLIVLLLGFPSLGYVYLDINNVRYSLNENIHTSFVLGPSKEGISGDLVIRAQAF